MPAPTFPPTRRHALVGGLLGGLALTGCATHDGSSPQPGTAAPSPDPADLLAELERTSGRVVGVTVLDETGAVLLAHRADELFPMCSVFKVLAVAALLVEHGLDDDDWWRTTQIDYDEADIVVNSTVLEARTGPITPEELADAALRFSDNTAGNLLLEQLGGPGAVTSFARSLGADQTRLDRWEPELNAAEPGDPRDTSTPADLGLLLHGLLVGRVAGAFVSARLQSWMLRNTTSDTRMRAALPPSDQLADKTGAGAYGVTNDAGVRYPENGPPRTVVVLTRTDDRDAEIDDAVLVDVAEIAFAR